MLFAVDLCSSLWLDPIIEEIILDNSALSKFKRHFDKLYVTTWMKGKVGVLCWDCNVCGYACLAFHGSPSAPCTTTYKVCVKKTQVWCHPERKLRSGLSVLPPESFHCKLCTPGTRALASSSLRMTDDEVSECLAWEQHNQLSAKPNIHRLFTVQWLTRMFSESLWYHVFVQALPEYDAGTNTALCWSWGLLSLTLTSSGVYCPSVTSMNPNS